MAFTAIPLDDRRLVNLPGGRSVGFRGPMLIIRTVEKWTDGEKVKGGLRQFAYRLPRSF
jgi:hypothetical protein